MLALRLIVLASLSLISTLIAVSSVTFLLDASLFFRSWIPPVIVRHESWSRQPISTTIPIMVAVSISVDTILFSVLVAMASAVPPWWAVSLFVDCCCLGKRSHSSCSEHCHQNDSEKGSASAADCDSDCSHLNVLWRRLQRDLSPHREYSKRDMPKQ